MSVVEGRCICGLHVLGWFCVVAQGTLIDCTEWPISLQELVEVLADGQWWLHKEGWNCEGGNLDSYYNHPVCAYHDVSCYSCAL